MMAQVMLLEAVMAGPSRGGAQNPSGTGLFAQSLGNALANLGDGGLMQALLNLPAGSQPTAEEAAVALENLKAMGAPGALVAALKALSAQADASETTDDKRPNEPFGELVAMLMPLVGRINAVPVSVDGSADTPAEGAMVATAPQADGAAGTTGATQAKAAAEAATALAQAAATAGAFDQSADPTADGAAQARPAEPVAPAVPAAQASATTPSPFETASSVTEETAVAPAAAEAAVVSQADAAPANEEAVTSEVAKAPAPKPTRTQPTRPPLRRSIPRRPPRPLRRQSP